MLHHFHSFFFNAPATPEIYTLSLHDALPISRCFRYSAREGRRASSPRPRPSGSAAPGCTRRPIPSRPISRSEEHTSELQSHHDLVCRLLLEKKNKRKSYLSSSFYVRLPRT